MRDGAGLSAGRSALAQTRPGYALGAPQYPNKLYADLAASRPLAAQRNHQKIVVEIKTFSEASPLSAFHAALGQYIFYRDLIRETAPDFDLYLAIHEIAHRRLFLKPSIQLGIRRNHVKFFVVDLNQGKIILWNPIIAT